MKLSKPEKYLLYRRRLRRSRERAAVMEKVSRYEIAKREKITEFKATLKTPQITAKKYEAWYILRRRKGWSIRRLAKVLSVSHVRIIRMEDGQWDGKLLETYWKQEALS